MTRKGRALSQSQLIICSICLAFLGQSIAAPVQTQQDLPQGVSSPRTRSDSTTPIADSIIPHAQPVEDSLVAQDLPTHDFSTGWIPGLYHQPTSTDDQAVEITNFENVLNDQEASDTVSNDQDSSSTTHYPHKRQLLPVDDATYTLGKRLRQQRIFGIPITTSADWAHGRWAYDLEFGPRGMMHGFKRWVGMDHYRRCQFNEGCMRAALGVSRKVAGRD